MSELSDFCEATYFSNKTVKKASKIEMKRGLNSSSLTRDVQLLGEDVQSQVSEDWDSGRRLTNDDRARLEKSESISSVSSCSRTLSNVSSRMLEEESSRKVAESNNEEQMLRRVEAGGIRRRLTDDLLAKDFDVTMDEMFQDFESRLSRRSLWNETGNKNFFGERRRKKILAAEHDDLFSGSNLRSGSGLSRSGIVPSLFDQAFEDPWLDKKSNMDDEYAESGVFSDRVSSRLSQQTDDASDFSAKQLEKSKPLQKFEVEINVQGFKADEILVRTEGRKLVITAMKKDAQGIPIPGSKDVNRKIVLPDGVNPYEVTSNLLPDGYLKVEAPIKRNDESLTAKDFAKDGSIEIGTALN